MHLRDTKTSRGAVELVVIDDAEVVKLIGATRSRIVKLDMQLQNARHLNSYHKYVGVLPDQF